jgi:hypothetical protein
MFEIIMLFAFLYAATCQLFPERSAKARAPINKKSLPNRKKRILMHRSTKQHSVKTKSRSHSYAHAA